MANIVTEPRTAPGRTEWLAAWAIIACSVAALLVFFWTATSLAMSYVYTGLTGVTPYGAVMTVSHVEPSLHWPPFVYAGDWHQDAQKIEACDMVITVPAEKMPGRTYYGNLNFRQQKVAADVPSSQSP